jgi:glycosyltransferase involved in cell wall biosynthesis
MPKLVGAMKVKDEEIFIEKTVSQILKYVDALVVVDDWSIDKTVQIIQDLCLTAKKPLRIEKAPNKTYHEHSVGNLELQLVHELQGEWCIQIDADDVYERQFVINISKYILLKSVDVIYAGATHMWSLEEKDWWKVDHFRIDSGWMNWWTKGQVAIQHRRPALFRIIKGQDICGYARDHGYLCPKEIFNSTRKFDPQESFCHFGYAVPSLIEKKCIRHGNIPALTHEETHEGIIYPPDYHPEGFTPEINIETFKKSWMNQEGMQLMKFPRTIWS